MNKNGFTIVETIIAFVIISVVALAATSIITISKSSTEQSNSEILATNFCDNSFELSRAISQRNSFDEFYGEFYVATSAININIPQLPCNQFDIYVDKYFNQTSASEYAYKCSYSFTNISNVLTLTITTTTSNDEVVCAHSYYIILTEGV